MKKILTIVIPTYNMQDYLRRCLDSLIVPEEQMKQLEVLVVNDGSKDNSSAIAHEYQNKYPGTFRVIDKENGNYGSCVNKGIDEAKGIYFRILDADDWFLSQGLVGLLKKISQNQDTDILVTNFTTVDKINNCEINTSLPHFSYNKVYRLDEINLSLCRDVILMHTLTFKTSILKENNIRLQTGISYTDTEYVYFPLKYAQTIIFYDIVLYQYFLGREGQSVSNSVSSKNINNYNRVCDRILTDYVSYIKTPSVSDYRQKNISIPLFNIVRAYFCNSLVYAKFDINSEKAMRNVLAVIQSNDIGLYKTILKAKTLKIPYVYLWVKFGIYTSAFPYNQIYKLLKKFKG